MSENFEYYKIYRKSPIELVQEYLNLSRMKKNNESDVKFSLLNLIKSKVSLLNYNDLLIVQSSQELWCELMSDKDHHFKRGLCRNLYNISISNIEKELGFGDTAARNLFSKTGMPTLIRAYKLGILSNHPWQNVNKMDPDELSYPAFSEYFFTGAAKRINIKDLGNELLKVKSITGYVITNPQEIFPQELSPVTGRWVTTYPEMNYFEFHLPNKPIKDQETIQNILNIFPSAKDILTTYIPFRPYSIALWIMIPKAGMENEYAGILKELTIFRDNTKIFYP